MWFSIRFIKKLHISPYLVFLLACFWYFRQGNPLLHILAAMLLHECGHLLCLAAMGKELLEIRFDLFGAVIRSGPLTRREELFCALSGPAVNLISALILRNNPLLHVIHAGLLVVNMLPVYPLDGGRILSCALSCFLPFDQIRRTMHCINLAVSFCVMLVVTSFCACVSGGWLPMALCALVLLRLGRSAEEEGF